MYLMPFYKKKKTNQHMVASFKLVAWGYSSPPPFDPATQVSFIDLA